MNDWFTIQNIDNSTFSISEYGHWEKPHSYLFVGTEKSVLVDTGLGIGDIKKEVERLATNPILVIITHAHWDHTSGCGGFDDIAIHSLGREWLENGLPISEEEIKSNLLREPFTKRLPDNFDIKKWKPFIGKVALILKDEDEIDLGGRTLKIIHTPGHSPGHVCVYEEATGYIATGDLFYKGKLDAFYESTNPIKFKQSLDKISRLKINKILPGHNELGIPTSYIQEACEAFNSLERNGQLKQGTGIHNFDHFSIHL